MNCLKHMSWMAPLLAVACVTVPCFADELPQRMAGLWESKTTVNGKSVTIRQCVGGEHDPVLESLRGAARGVCGKQSLVKTADGYKSEYTCQIGSVSIEGTAILTGDLNSAFTLESKSVRTGMPGTSGPVTRVMTAKAQRLGACESGQKPGDLIMPDGSVMHSRRGTR